MSLSLIVAVSQNSVIGHKGDMPWGRSLKPDLRRFKAITLGHPVIMGRKTWDSLAGKPLAGRTNIVVSRDVDALELPTGVLGAENFDEARILALTAPGGDETMVIGGGQLYKAALGLAKRIYLTKVDFNYPGDTFFPELKATEWATIGRATGLHESLPYEFLTLQRSST